jgi:hypothetical protein
MKKRKAVDSSFHAIRNTVGKDKSVIMPYGNRSFPPSSKDEDSVPRGSMKRHLLTRSAGEHRTSRGCLFCQKNDLVSVTADGTVHRCIGGGALRAIGQKKLDVVKARPGEGCKKTSWWQ